MRIGRNPLTNKPATYKLPQIVAAVITHLPNQEGYHTHRMEVIQTSLRTLRAGTGLKPHIVIWDNGSCNALTDWLRLEYCPDTLVLSPNVGKSSARAALVRMFPSETIIAVADDDILYYPNWLEKQVAVLEHFPNVGCVTGNPIRTSFRWGTENTRAWGQKNGKLEVGRFISDKYEHDFCMSIGRNYTEHGQGTVHDFDYRITYQGMTVYAHGHHCQFIARAGVIAPFCRFDANALPEEKSFDISIDMAGLLRLCTIERNTRHIGNVIDESIRKDAQQILLQEMTE